MDRVTRNEAQNSRLFITSLARGLMVLEALARAGTALTLTELAAATAMNKVTVSRFCFTLTHLGYLEKTPEKRYRLTPKILNLGYGVLCNLDLCDVGEPYLRELSLRLDETVNMAVLEGLEIIYVARFKTEQILSTELHIGSTLPVYCTAMGKAIVAHLPERQRQELVDRLEFIPLTHRTLIDRHEFLDELEGVRRSGLAINDEELSIGLRSIAAPILRGGTAVAAVNVAVPTTRYSRQSLIERISTPLQETAREISRILDKQVPGRLAR